MIEQTLTKQISIGQSRYEPGTKVETGREPCHQGTRDECWLTRFPNGEETYLNPSDLSRS